MSSTGRPSDSRRPPFSPAAAKAAREQLGMSPAHVAQGMAAFGVRVTPATVAGFEAGEASPTEQELFALAGALWCDRDDLTGRIQTLRGHRQAQGMTVDDAAGVLGVAPEAYTRMEDDNSLRAADPRRAMMLAQALHLPVRDAVEVAGDLDQLRDNLVNAVQGWWKGYARAVSGAVPLPKPIVTEALRRLHGEYQSLSAGTTNWSTIFANEDDEPVSDAKARAFLENIVDHFWQSVDAVPPKR